MTVFLNINRAALNLARIALLGTVVLIASTVNTESAEQVSKRPNLVLCMADDLGWGDTKKDLAPPQNQTESTESTTHKNTRLFLLSGQSNMANMDPQVSFTPTLRDAFPNDQLIVVKVAYGGRPIARWVPRGKIYKELIEKAKRAVHEKDVTTITFVWMQGERDHQEDETTLTYKENLETLYRQLTEDFDRSDIHFVIGRLSDARLGTPNWDKIRSIQVEVAQSLPFADWIDTDDLNGPTNGVHCPPEGYKQMGQRFAQKAIDLIKKPPM